MLDARGGVSGLDLRWDMFAPNSSRSFDLVLQLRRQAGTAFGRLDYSTAILDQPTARDFMLLFGETLERAATADGRLRASGAVVPPTARGVPDRPKVMSARPSPGQVVCAVGAEQITATDVLVAAAKIRQDPLGGPRAAPLSLPLRR